MLDDSERTRPVVGYCECGCGQKTAVAKRNRLERGVRKGDPARYAPRHAGRARLTSRTPLASEFGEPTLPEVIAPVSEMDELWHPVVGREGFYEVSDQGRVRRVAQRISMNRCDDAVRMMPGRILAPDHDKSGYLRVCLSVDGEYRRHSIHRLVCEAFHGGAADPKLVVRHLNAVKTDNRAANLAWGTSRENAQDTIILGRNHELKKTHCGYGHPFDDTNTYVTKQGHRSCRTCHRNAERRRLAIKRGAA